MYSVIDISTYEIRWFLVCFCLFYPYFDAFTSDFSNICQHSYPYNHLYINILKTRMTVTDVFQLYTCARTRARETTVASLLSLPQRQGGCRANSAWGNGDAIPCAPRNKWLPRNWTGLG